MLDAVFSLDEHHAGCEYEEGVGHVQQGGIEYGVRSEYRCHYGIADETNVSKHQCESDHSLGVVVFGYESRYEESECQEYDVCQYAYSQQR